MSRTDDAPQSTPYIAPSRGARPRVPICPTCAKAGAIPCLKRDASGTLVYRDRPQNPDERRVFTFHPQLGVVQVLVRRQVVHGLEYEVIAEPVLCFVGVALATGWSLHSLRKYGAHLPGRITAARRRAKRSASGRRRPPTPMNFNTAPLMTWLLQSVEPMPKNTEEFLRLVAVLTRRLSSGEAFEAVLAAYRADLLALMGVDDEDYGGR